MAMVQLELGTKNSGHIPKKSDSQNTTSIKDKRIYPETARLVAYVGKRFLRA